MKTLLLIAALFLASCGPWPQVIFIDSGGYQAPDYGFQSMQPMQNPLGDQTLRCSGYGRTPNFGTGGCF